MENFPTLDEFNFILLALRLVVGPTFAFHGYAKIFRGGRLAGTGRWFDSMGMKPGHVHARLAAFGEIATGLAITLGLFTTLGGLGLVGLMFVAFWTVHKGSGLLVAGNGWEYNLVLGAIGVTFATIGAGEWSLDNVLGIHINGMTGFVISLVGGLAMAGGLLGTFYRPPTPEPAADADSESASSN